MPWFHGKKRTATVIARSQSIGLSCAARCWDAIRNTGPITNIVELKTALLSIWNDLPQEFIDKA